MSILIRTKRAPDQHVMRRWLAWYTPIRAYRLHESARWAYDDCVVSHSPIAMYEDDFLPSASFPAEESVPGPIEVASDALSAYPTWEAWARRRPNDFWQCWHPFGVA